MEVALQRHEVRRSGANINRELKKKKQFRNPSILDRESARLGIFEIGSNLPLDKFSPSCWPASAFYDALLKKQDELYLKEEDKKKQSSRGTRTIEFREGRK